MTFGYEFEKRGSVSRRGVRLRGEGSGTATSIPGKEGKVVVTEWEVGGLEGWGQLESEGVEEVVWEHVVT